jgi:putative nucleotidyltransferase with HDIG domain
MALVFVGADPANAEAFRSALAVAKATGFLPGRLSFTQFAAVDDAVHVIDECMEYIVVLDLSQSGGVSPEAIVRFVHVDTTIPVVVMVNPADLQTAETAFRFGALDCIVWGQLDSLSLQRIVWHAARVDEVHRSIRADAAERRQREAALGASEDRPAQAFAEVRRMAEGAIRAIARIVENWDLYTAGHQRRVAALARAIARELRLDRDVAEAVYYSALVHDIGKINIPVEILCKPGRLNNAEMELIRSHPSVGHTILSAIEFPWPVAEIVLQHHERLNGSGYPNRLRAEEIRLEARIIAVADVVEAMSSHRPYRPALGLGVALLEMRRNKEELYDASVAEACIRIAPNWNLGESVAGFD